MQHKQHLHPRQGVNARKVGTLPTPSVRLPRSERLSGVREAEGLQNDNDFAYAYVDYDQVLGLAGHHVADDWLQTRARVEEGLLAAGARWKATLMFLPSHAQ